MVRRKEHRRSQEVPHMRDGKGVILLDHLLEPDDFAPQGRLFAVNTLRPGCSIGEHQHVGDFEVYFITAGQGLYNDNGTMMPVAAGDVCIVEDGGTHSIENKGDTDLVFTALIVFTR